MSARKVILESQVHLATLRIEQECPIIQTPGSCILDLPVYHLLACTVDADFILSEDLRKERQTPVPFLWAQGTFDCFANFTSIAVPRIPSDGADDIVGRRLG